MKVRVEIEGTTRTYNVCTRCLRTADKNGIFTKKITVVPANAGAKAAAN